MAVLRIGALATAALFLVTVSWNASTRQEFSWLVLGLRVTL